MPPPGFGALHAPRTTPLALRLLPPLRLSRWDGLEAPNPTEVRLGHDGERLLVEFRARHRGVVVDPEEPHDRPTKHLWLRDVVEVFVSDDPSGSPYRELEVSPLGQWLALSFEAPRKASPTPWQPTPQIRAELTPDTYRVELAIHLDQLRSRPTANGDWRIGLFRIGGSEPSREYSSHVVTPGATPDFHQPACWTPLVFG